MPRRREIEEKRTEADNARRLAMEARTSRERAKLLSYAQHLDSEVNDMEKETPIALLDLAGQ